MGELKYQNISVKLAQLLISVSVCSFIFSPSSLLVFLHYFKFYFSTFPSQLYSHNIDKNSMFLLCNGLLVFVGISKSFSWSNDKDDKPSELEGLSISSSKYVEDGSQSYVLDVEANDPILEEEDIFQTSEPDEQDIAAEQAIEIENCVEEEVEKNIEKVIFVDEEQGKGSVQLNLEEEEMELDEETELFDVVDEEEGKGSENEYFLIEENMEEEEDVEEEEEDDEEEEESNMLSTEELNQKFEDFIRKMREDLRIEARRQLVMV